MKEAGRNTAVCFNVLHDPGVGRVVSARRMEADQEVLAELDGLLGQPTTPSLSLLLHQYYTTLLRERSNSLPMQVLEAHSMCYAGRIQSL